LQLYDWDGDEDTLCCPDKQSDVRYFKEMYTNIIVQTPDVEIISKFDTFVLMYIGKRRIGSDTQTYSAVSAIHGRTMNIHELRPVYIDIIQMLDSKSIDLGDIKSLSVDFKKPTNRELLDSILTIDSKNRHEFVKDDLFSLQDVFAGKTLNKISEDNSVFILTHGGWDRSTNPHTFRFIDQSYPSQYADIFNSLYNHTFKGKFEEIHGSMDDKLMNNVLIAGGYIADYLRSGKLNNRKDVDIFLYGLDKKQAQQKVIDLITYFTKGHLIISMTVSKNCISVIYLNPNKPSAMRTEIQIILRLYNTKSEILHGFDIGMSSVGWDGNEILFTSLSKFSYEYNTIIVDVSRRSQTYEKRLIKYGELVWYEIPQKPNIAFMDMIPHTDVKISNTEEFVIQLPYLKISVSGYIYHDMKMLNGYIGPWHLQHLPVGYQHENEFSLFCSNSDYEYRHTLLNNINNLLNEKDDEMVYRLHKKSVNAEFKRNLKPDDILSFNKLFGGNYETKFHQEGTKLVRHLQKEKDIKTLDRNKVQIIRRFLTFEKLFTRKQMNDILQLFLDKNNDVFSYISKTLCKNHKLLHDKIEHIRDRQFLGFNWMTENVMTQLTSSFNPLDTTPQKWYGKFYKKY
jgi:hypothetical protein